VKPKKEVCNFKDSSTYTHNLTNGLENDVYNFKCYPEGAKHVAASIIAVLGATYAMF